MHDGTAAASQTGHALTGSRVRVAGGKGKLSLAHDNDVRHFYSTTYSAALAAAACAAALAAFSAMTSLAG